MIVNIIIGKDSNLTKFLEKALLKSVSISARDILQNCTVLEKYKSKRINIIFNNFQRATHLNNLESATDYVTNSIVTTAKVLDYFKGSEINKILYTSSSSVYGNNILCNEKDELKPMNLHASLKVANEKLVEKFCNDNNIDYTVARIFNMYGGDDKFSVLSKIIKAHTTSEELTIVNKGNAIRDFIHIEDVVDIYVKLLEIKNLKIINIGTGNGSSIKNILDFLANNGVHIKTKNIFKDELKTSTADIRLLDERVQKEKFIEIQEYLKKEFDL